MRTHPPNSRPFAVANYLRAAIRRPAIADYLRAAIRRLAIADYLRAANPGDHPISSRRRATITIYRADGRPSNIVAPTGDQ